MFLFRSSLYRSGDCARGICTNDHILYYVLRPGSFSDGIQTQYKTVGCSGECGKEWLRHSKEQFNYETLDEDFNTGLYKLKFSLLHHVVEDLKTFGFFDLLNVSHFE